MSTATKLISASRPPVLGKPAEYFYYVASKLVSGSYGYRASLFEVDVTDPDNISTDIHGAMQYTSGNNFNYYTYAMRALPVYNGVAVAQPQSSGYRLQFKNTRSGSTTSWTTINAASRISGIQFDEDNDALFYTGDTGSLYSIDASDGTAKDNISVNSDADYYGAFYIENKSKILLVAQYSSSSQAGIVNVSDPDNLSAVASNITISNLYLQHPISEACVYDDANDRLWAVTNGGLRCYTYNGSNAFTLTNTFDFTSFFGTIYRAFCLNCDFTRGLAFVSSYNGLGIYDISDPTNISQTDTYNTYKVGTHKYDPVGKNIFACANHYISSGGVLSFDVSDSSNITLRDQVVYTAGNYSRNDDAPSSAILFEE